MGACSGSKSNYMTTHTNPRVVEVASKLLEHVHLESQSSLKMPLLTSFSLKNKIKRISNYTCLSDQVQ